MTTLQYGDEERQFVRDLHRYRAGLLDGTIGRAQFRWRYRHLIVALGDELAEIIAEVLWPEELGAMPPPAPINRRSQMTASPSLDGELLPPLDSVIPARAFPIATVPIAAGQELDPLLLWPGPAHYPGAPQWVFGRYTAEGEWCDDQGSLFEPTYWAPLPSVPG
jgi:hypothetical protein